MYICAQTFIIWVYFMFPCFSPVSVTIPVNVFVRKCLMTYDYRRYLFTTPPLNWLAGLIDVFHAFCRADHTGNIHLSPAPTVWDVCFPRANSVGSQTCLCPSCCDLVDWITNLWNMNEKRKRGCLYKDCNNEVECSGEDPRK